MKKRIEFFNEIGGVADLFPIIESKDYNPNWIKKAREDYLQWKKKKGQVDVHLYRCPGIFDLFNYGYIVRSWCDVTMEIPKETIEDGKFQGTAAWKLFPIIASHPDYIMKFIPRPKGTLNNYIRINTLWHIVAPKGIKFLFLPLPYPDSFEFYNAPGILDPSINAEINLQLFWNVTGSYLIKAGTPLGQLIPLTEKKYDFICRDMNTNDKDWLYKFRSLKKHSSNEKKLSKRNKVKEAYEKHFKLN